MLLAYSKIVICLSAACSSASASKPTVAIIKACLWFVVRQEDSSCKGAFQEGPASFPSKFGSRLASQLLS